MINAELLLETYALIFKLVHLSSPAEHLSYPAVCPLIELYKPTKSIRFAVASSSTRHYLDGR